MQRFIPVMLAIGLLTGCTAGTHGRLHYEKILWDGIHSNRIVTDALEQSSKPGKADLDAIRSKSSLSLGDCCKLALVKSEKLAISGEDYFQSVIAQDKALSQVLPTVNARGQYYRQEMAPDFGRTSGFSPRARSESYVKLSQPIFSGFRDLYTMQAYKALSSSKEHSLAHLREQVLLLVSAVYFDALDSAQQTEVLTRSLNARKQRLADLKERRAANLVRETEVLLVEAQVAEDEALLARVTNDHTVLLARLGTLTGISITDKGLLQPAEIIIDGDADALLLKAYENRNDLRSLKSEMLASHENVRAVYAEYFPKVTLDSTLYLRRVGISEDVDWDVLISAELPLFEGWLTRAKVAEALSNERKASLAYEDLRGQIKDEVVTAYYDVRSYESAVARTEKELEYARRNYELLKQEYDNKIATNLELLLADVALQDVQIRLNSERLRKKIAALRLKLACGDRLLAGAE